MNISTKQLVKLVVETMDYTSKEQFDRTIYLLTVCKFLVKDTEKGDMIQQAIWQIKDRRIKIQK